MKFWYLHLAVALSLTILPGCGSTTGGGGTGSGGQTSPPASLDGPWEVLFHSNLAPDKLTVLEANLTSTNKHLSSETNGAVIFQTHWNGGAPLLQVSHLGGGCHESGSDEVIFDGTVEDPKLGTQGATFTLTENSTLGSAIITATASITSTEGVTRISGTYSLPAACGLSEDNGTISGGAYKNYTTFSQSNVYTGILNGKAAVVWFAAGGVNATGGGTYDGESISLTGFASGNALTMKGVISGQQITWFALYDATYNQFFIYDPDANLLGTLLPK
jgi:hypothetical protein